MTPKKSKNMALFLILLAIAALFYAVAASKYETIF
jgi:hypothetical protein